MKSSSSETKTPRAVVAYISRGFVETGPLFNLGFYADDNVARYDLSDPNSSMRVIWTPHSDEPTEQIVQKVVGDQKHPVFFPIIERDEEGELRRLPSGVRSLRGTLENSPYVDSYTESLRSRAESFVAKLALFDEMSSDSLGVTIDNLAINHNGFRYDDVFFTIFGPVRSIKAQEFHRNPQQFLMRIQRNKRRFIRNIIENN